MLETVIVGGGMCGLALADALRQAGKPFALFEARLRLGGRVLTEVSTLTGGAIDLGPTLFWPETQPYMLALVKRFGLSDYPQHDRGGILRLTDPNQPPETVEVAGVHGGAHRISGGMGALVDGFARVLPTDAIHFGHALEVIEDHGDHVTLHFRANHDLVTFKAKRVVLTMPPRLLAEHVKFTPELSDELMQAMRGTHTWMADQAKAVTAYPTAFWRDAGHSGNAFVSHPQTVLSEIFDACDATADKAALGGFVALPPESREPYKRSMPLLVESQLTQVFGKAAENGELHYQDWSAEKYTCSSLDSAPPLVHPIYGDQYLRNAYWSEKLYFGGAETASHAGGYLEGALEAAARLKRALISQVVRKAGDNSSSLQRFQQWVTTQRQHAQTRYRSHLNHTLASQYKEQVTQRALLGTIEQIYNEALQQIDELPFDMEDIPIEQGRTALTPELLTTFSGFSRDIVEAALEFNRGSCAISDFPLELAPDPSYMNVIQRDLSAAWLDFAVSVNEVLLSK